MLRTKKRISTLINHRLESFFVITLFTPPCHIANPPTAPPYNLHMITNTICTILHERRKKSEQACAVIILVAHSKHSKRTHCGKNFEIRRLIFTISIWRVIAEYGLWIFFGSEFATSRTRGNALSLSPITLSAQRNRP